MSEWLQYLMIPLIVTILGGVIILILKTMRLRRAMVSGMVNEINAIITQARQIQEYLSKENHEWYMEGKILDEPPIFTPEKNLIYETFIEYLYLLKKNEINKITLFYGKALSCTNRVVILFHRIQQQSDSKKALTKKQISMNKLRAKKVYHSLEALCNISNHSIKKLSDLPEIYNEIDTTEIDRKMNDVKKTAN
ncbi:hypothetical protein [uncultured Croceitalea sp.]|uniref:hypothetical protein n=1 Tax=uncultured Croceitalea sp. TaxID=1798908 RepID=UPI003305C1C7